MSTTSALMTFEQFSALPENRNGRQELHHGVPVCMPPPKHKHWIIVDRLSSLFKQLASGRGVAGAEFGFRPVPEHEFWTADVVYISQARYAAINPDGNMHGVPELVIEVLSPSNTASEMNEREAMCLENGALEFWIVDPERKTVRVSTPDRKSITYIEGEKIPLRIPIAAEIAVTDIFPA
jgi:Uma2 family endonuclease